MPSGAEVLKAPAISGSEERNALWKAGAACWSHPHRSGRWSDGPSLCFDLMKTEVGPAKTLYLRQYCPNHAVTRVWNTVRLRRLIHLDGEGMGRSWQRGMCRAFEEHDCLSLTPTGSEQESSVSRDLTLIWNAERFQLIILEFSSIYSKVLQLLPIAVD